MKASRMKIFLAVITFVGLTASHSLAHEFWIDALKYQVETTENVQGNFKNGQSFEGTTLAYFENRTVRYEAFPNGQSTAVTGRMGDTPALNLDPQPEGLLVVIHQTVPSKLTYSDWAKFQKFADHKDFPDIGARHDALGFPRDKFRESYSRFAKVLIAVGDGEGADSFKGIETEFVALTNPYADPLTEGMAVQLFYQNEPRADAQVEVFDRAPDGSVTVSLHRTDEAGIARVPVTAGHAYLFDAVVLRPSARDDGTVWETLWAALTFAVPAR
jgi:uncharacterized GH25 family protein